LKNALRSCNWSAAISPLAKRALVLDPILLLALPALLGLDGGQFDAAILESLSDHSDASKKAFAFCICGQPVHLLKVGEFASGGKTRTPSRALPINMRWFERVRRLSSGITI
jgi:hypothetical protein